MEQTTPLSAGYRGEGWHLGLRRNLMVVVLGPLLAVVFVVCALLAHGEHRSVQVVVYLLVAVAFAPSPWFRSRRRVPPYSHEGAAGSGLMLPVNPMGWGGVVSLVLLGALAWAAFVGLLIRIAHEESLVTTVAVGALFAVLIAGPGCLFLLGAYGGVRARLRGDRGLLLTPDAVVVTTERRRVVVPWSAIRAIRPHWTQRRQGFFGFDDIVHNWLTLDADPDQVRGRTRLGALAQTRAPTVDAEQVACGPALALAVLRWYLDQPETRNELRSDLAVDRAAALERSLADASPA